ncbi:MAG: hypothetical protein ACKPCM_08185 [Pseudanabaena sp.]
MSKTPIPLIPFSVWRWIFIQLAHRYWDQQAANSQVSKDDVYAQPYTDIETTHTLVS